jgi:hypothetical protein
MTESTTTRRVRLADATLLGGEMKHSGAVLDVSLALANAIVSSGRGSIVDADTPLGDGTAADLPAPPVLPASDEPAGEME